MKKLLSPIKSKKGISEIVSYTLLIIIAVAVSVLVFSFLRSYIPKYQTPECPTDINIDVRDIICSSRNLEITLSNKGLFSIDAAFVRLNPPGREVKSLVAGDSLIEFENPLIPGNITTIEVALNSYTPGAGFRIEVQPARFNEKNELAACENLAIQKNLTCS